MHELPMYDMEYLRIISKPYIKDLYLPNSEDSRYEIHDNYFLHEIASDLGEREMCRIFRDVIIPILRILELDYECVYDASLREGTEF